MSKKQYTFQIPCNVSPHRFFEFGPRDAHKHAKKTIPHIVADATCQNGDGQTGTVRNIRFQEGLPFAHIKIHTDALDMNNYVFGFTILEGGNVGKKLESASYSIKIIKTTDGKWMYEMNGDLTPRAGVEFSNQDIEEEKNFFIHCIKSVDDYLLKNPNSYP